MSSQLISNEEFTSIREAQISLTRLFAKGKKKGVFFRLLKNNKPLGVLLPNTIWESFLEDMEALKSATFQEKIARARIETQLISSQEVKKKVNV